MANGSTLTTSSIQKARSRLDEALTRLENAINSRSGDSGNNPELEKALTLATTEIAKLKENKQTVSNRLDGAIGQLKELLKDG